MRIAALILPILSGVLLVACASNGARVVQTDPGYGIAERGRQIIGDTLDGYLLSGMTLDYVNLFRARYDLPRLNPERTASLCAQWMAGYQARRSQVTHEANDVPTMRVFPLRYRAVGGDTYARGGENAGWYRLYEPELARPLSYDEMARRIVDGWINSPSHRRILLSAQGEFEGTVGIGIARGRFQGIEGVYSTMNVFFPWPDQVTLSSSMGMRN
jgi:hypothetical protein